MKTLKFEAVQMNKYFSYDTPSPSGKAGMGPKILVFDNYDSFTYNLVHLVEKITHIKVDVYRNDQLPLEKVKEYDKIILEMTEAAQSQTAIKLFLCGSPNAAHLRFFGAELN